MQRRSFLGALIAAAAAPAIVRADSLMPLYVPRPPKLWGDGIHDDTAALQWLDPPDGPAVPADLTAALVPT